MPIGYIVGTGYKVPCELPLQHEYDSCAKCFAPQQ